MPKNLKRRHGTTKLHFITFSCYRRLAFLRTVRARDAFLIVLNEVRGRYRFVIVGYVVMPEHVHLLIGESEKANPSVVVQVLKQRVSRRLRGRSRGRSSAGQLSLWKDAAVADAKLWAWSSYRFYQCGEESLCTPDGLND
jgi:REP element-mobilizing transposase RayT